MPPFPPGAEREKGEAQAGTAPAARPGQEALGRSRGGLTSKFHLAVDGRGRPLALVVTEGQRHDSTQLMAVLDAIRVPRQVPGRPSQPGRPRKRPDLVVLDKGYSYQKCRALLRRRGIRHMIPERQDQREQRAKKGSRGGRPCRYSSAEYRQRSWVERGINRLKQWRRIATRYEKRAANYRAFLVVAAILMWL